MAPEVIAAIIAAVVALINILTNKRFIDSATAKNQAEIKALAEKNQREIQIEIEKTNDKIKDVELDTEKVLGLVQGKGNVNKLFETMVKDIESYLDSETIKREVQLRHISVSASYSWKYFLEKDLLPLLESPQYKNADFQLDLLIVDHTYLRDLGIRGRLTDWRKESQNREDDFPRLLEQCAGLGSRFKFQARKYKNLPHWHGWLFNNKNLYLGRTGWETAPDERDSKLYLTVGTNKYRQFVTPNDDGRIKLFNEWFTYYWADSHERVICSNY